MEVRRDFVLNKEAYKVRPMSTSYFHKNFFVRLIENLRVHEVCKQVEEQGSKIVLEVGCEEGYVASKLQSPSYLIGLDFQKEPLNKAKKRFDDVVCGDTQNLPFKNKSVGCVICSETLEHVDDPLIALREISRVARYLVLSVPHDKKILSAKKLLATLGFRSLLGELDEETVPEHLHCFSKRRLLSMLKRNFIVEKIVSIPCILDLFRVFSARTIEEGNHALCSRS